MNRLRTLVIFTEVPDEHPKFVFLEGDYRYLNGVYINAGENEEKEQEVLKLFYGPKGEFLQPVVESPVKLTHVQDADFVIHCGFYL
jgi:hypothetical protein